LSPEDSLIVLQHVTNWNKKLHFFLIQNSQAPHFRTAIRQQKMAL
jgi:hypothetical protein